ncbi:MAG TPA: hypothetical protein VHX17_09520 [Candidatus Cybelea sp.]|jgi:hypothetical protein|nr:hypothetical protein [Candidatus Cybelea sp.]
MKAAACTIGMFIALCRPEGSIAAGESYKPTGSISSLPATPVVLAKAKEWFYRFQNANIDRSQLNALTNAELTTDVVLREAARLKRLGAPTSFKFQRSYTFRSALAYDFLLQFPSSRVIEMIAFDSSGKIAGFDFATFVEGDR